MKHFILSGICTCLLLQLLGQGNSSSRDIYTGAGVGADTGIIDLHCHPSLKMYLFNEHMWHCHHPSAGMNLIPMQMDTRTLSANTVKGFVATHYLLEKGFVKRSLINIFLPLLEVIAPSLVVKVENEDYTNFAQINNMLNVMELQVREANIRNKNLNLRIVKSFSEFEEAINDGAIPVAHGIEGAHALGRNMAFSKKRSSAQKQKMAYASMVDSTMSNEFSLTKEDEKKLSRDKKTSYEKYRKIKAPEYRSMEDSGRLTAKKYIQNLVALHDRGVCMMSLSHFLPNDLTRPTEGISPDAKHGFKMDWGYNPDSDNVPLTPVGRAVVEKMLEIGMVVDLTHTNPTSRHEAFVINARLNQERVSKHLRPRPLIFSHAGAQTIFNEGNAGQHSESAEVALYGFYDASDEEIDSIKSCNGVIGVIPENFWLKACNKKINRCKCDYKKGIPIIIETIEHIHKRTGSYKNIAIGSDFDGLADAPKDLFEPTQYGSLIDAMRKSGISPDDIKLITHANALRILRDGWGN